MDYDKVTDLDTQELTIVKKKKKKSPSLHIYWRCTEIAKDDNIIIAFYVFYHPFVSSWWVFFGYGTNQSDLPYQMKGK
jgi:hypothetical protein